MYVVCWIILVTISSPQEVTSFPSIVISRRIYHSLTLHICLISPLNYQLHERFLSFFTTVSQVLEECHLSMVSSTRLLNKISKCVDNFLSLISLFSLPQPMLCIDIFGYMSNVWLLIVSGFIWVSVYMCVHTHTYMYHIDKCMCVYHFIEMISNA